MARLMAIPIRDKGDAVLIVTNCAGVILMGFVAETTLGPFFECPPTMGQCIAFVERHLPSFEHVLLHKSMATTYSDGSIACVEVEHADLVGAGVVKLH
jgi:hypothetical protein